MHIERRKGGAEIRSPGVRNPSGKPQNAYAGPLSRMVQFGSIWFKMVQIQRRVVEVRVRATDGGGTGAEASFLDWRVVLILRLSSEGRHFSGLPLCMG